MVFAKFHNMNRKKIFLMSPLNSNKLKSFTLQVKTSNIVLTCKSQFKNVQFSFLFFNLCTVYLKKMFVLSFFFFSFFFHMLCSTMFKFLLSFFLSVFFFPFSLSCSFLFLFWFSFLFSFFFFFFFIINCSFNVPFFSNLISTSLSLP